MDKKIVIKKKDLLGALLAVFFAVNVYNPYGLFHVSGNITRLLFFAAAAATGFFLLRAPRRYREDLLFFKTNIFRTILVPDIAVMLFSFAVTLFKHTGSQVIYTTWNMFLSRMLIVLFIWCCVRLLGEQAITAFFWGCALSYTYTLVKYFIDYGIVSGLRQATVGSYMLPIEVHNMTYIFGYLFLYFALADNGSKRSRIVKCIINLVFVYFGQKRMVFLSILLALGIWWLLHRFNGGVRKMIVRICCIAAIGIALLYIYAIISGRFAEIVNTNNIETSSRLRFYMYFAKNLPFSPSFIGKGITYTDVVMASNEGMNALNLNQATTLHNDVLRMYIGVGMIPTVLYLGVVIYRRTIIMQKAFCEQAGFYCFAITMAYFLNWFASNAGLEMWCFSGYAFCIITIMHRYSSENKEREKLPNPKGV